MPKSPEMPKFLFLLWLVGTEIRLLRAKKLQPSFQRFCQMELTLSKENYQN